MNEERGSASVTIAAPPDDVYAVVSDITRMGELSPECARCEWVDGATGPAEGARFRGYNAIGDMKWDVSCQVLRAEAGKILEFAAALDEVGDKATIWTYTFEEASGGTLVTESFYAPLVNTDGAPSNFPGRSDMLVQGCEKTLAALKAVVEGT